ncbi:MAG: hypothetical protein BWK75_04290 [Candidatus Altiarchaeales archaeon A3]|nr:MAG: hypothetical protein BWK75_04290 [Candidatus Altiarchaeales archaeon A3]
MKIANPDFSEHYKNHDAFGEEWTKKFLEYVDIPLRKSIRINTLKISSDEFFRKFTYDHDKILWSDNAYFIDEQKIGLKIEHAVGLCYSQESSAMIAAEALDVVNGNVVLDLCAAPGSKTTQIAVKNFSGTIVANELNLKRAQALIANIYRLGITNCIVTNYDACKFPELFKFDRVLLDAPCSSLGTSRKNKEILKTWEYKFSLAISKVQKKMILDAFSHLKKGGILVYSTCTTPPEENEDVVKFLIDNESDAEVEKIDLKVNCEKNEYGIRVYPWHNDTETAFVSKIRKK